MSYIYTEIFRIRTSEIDHNKSVHAHSLIQLMQEASMQHTIGLGVSAWDLEPKNITWVLLKMEVNFYHFPKLGDEVTVKTYPTALEGYFTYRDYYVYDAQGVLCASSSSMWTLMDTVARKMVKIPDEYSTLVFPVDQVLARPSLKLTIPQRVDQEYTLQVNYFHLDWNGHVNNVQIIRMIMESLDPQYLYHHRISKFNIQFKSEAILGQQLHIIHEQISSVEMKHVIKDASSGKELVVAMTSFEQKTT